MQWLVAGVGDEFFAGFAKFCGNVIIVGGLCSMVAKLGVLWFFIEIQVCAVKCVGCVASRVVCLVGCAVGGWVVSCWLSWLFGWSSGVGLTWCVVVQALVSSL